MPKPLLLNEHFTTGAETGAGLMRNRCAFTSRDMGEGWADAFTYAIVSGWDAATEGVAERFGWDAELVAFLKDARKRFAALSDSAPHAAPTQEGN